MMNKLRFLLIFLFLLISLEESWIQDPGSRILVLTQPTRWVRTKNLAKARQPAESEPSKETFLLKCNLEYTGRLTPNLSQSGESSRSIGQTMQSGNLWQLRAIGPIGQRCQSGQVNIQTKVLWFQKYANISGRGKTYWGIRTGFLHRISIRFLLA